MFGGLEEFDKSVEDSFSLKPNAKRLIIKKDGNSTLNTSRSSLNISQQQENIPPQSANTSIDQGSSKFGEPDQGAVNPRRVSWLRSNLDKIPQQGRPDSAANNTIHELVTKSKADKNVASGSGATDASSTILPGKSSVRFSASMPNDSLLSSRSFLDETSADLSLIEGEPHPTGITLKRAGYYTIPSLDDMLGYLSEDGSCVVPNFTIGRKGYGCVYFDEPIDVSGLNLDELVHFRHKEVVIYPDDDNKPPVGTELNRKAQITLDQVWPHDKTLHEPIKDKERLEMLNFEGKLRSVCDKHDTKFLEYRPETGSWVFKVDHFSKYGLSDSDDDETPVDPKKAKLAAAAVAAASTVDKMSTGAIPKQPSGALGLERSRSTFDAERLDRSEKCKIHVL